VLKRPTAPAGTGDVTRGSFLDLSIFHLPGYRVVRVFNFLLSAFLPAK